MIKTLKTARIPITLLLILVMLIPLFQSIKVSAAYETVGLRYPSEPRLKPILFPLFRVAET